MKSQIEYMLHTHLQHHNDTIINRRNDKNAGRLLYRYMWSLPLLQGFEKVCVGFYCERELEIEHNCNILTPTFMAVNVVSFSFFWCSTGALGSLCWVLAFFTASYQHLLWTPIHQGFPRAPSAGCGFPYHISSPTPSDLQLNSTWTPLARRTQLSYIIVRRPLNLWNRMFNRHQAEITVMQFRGHSLPVHHSVVAQWDLHHVPYYQP